VFANALQSKSIRQDFQVPGLRILSHSLAVTSSHVFPVNFRLGPYFLFTSPTTFTPFLSLLLGLHDVTSVNNVGIDLLITIMRAGTLWALAYPGREVLAHRALALPMSLE
jgi:hypothetical protein